MVLKKAAAYSLLAAGLLAWSAPPRPAANPRFPDRPKLVLILVIDQFRFDYLMRFRPYFVEGGFNRLLDGGAVFTDCRYDYATTMTGPGHATLLTGAYPASHGIVENNWYDRASKREVYCVEDLHSRTVASREKASSSPGYSPQYLEASTLGDELRMATDYRAKVVTVSLKDRAAVLMGGRNPSAAYWYDVSSGRFVTSTYYMPTLPAWADDFNQNSPINTFCGQKWQALEQTPGASGQVFADFEASAGETCPNRKFLARLEKTPFMNQAELAFATQVLTNEHLGQGPETDLLAVSLSVNDYIGHAFGPYSPQMADTVLRTDRELARFFDDLDRIVGLKNVWIALSADHGVAPSPAYVQDHKLGLGMAKPGAIRDAAERALAQAFGPGPWIDDQDETYLFLNRENLKARNVSESKAEEIAAEAALTQGDVAMALTRSQFLTGTLPHSEAARKAANSFNSARSGDVFLVFAPFAVPSASETGTTHGTPWNYDTQVPLIFLGSAFKPGIYALACQPVDLAATLAARLGLTQPSDAQGSPLSIALRYADQEQK